MHRAAHAELVEHPDAHVHKFVRRQGVDPQRHTAVVRGIARTVVRDAAERSLTGAVAPVADGPAVVGEPLTRVQRAAHRHLPALRRRHAPGHRLHVVV